MASKIPANVQSGHSVVLDGLKDGKAVSNLNGSFLGNGYTGNGINSHGSVFLNGHSTSRNSVQNGVMNGKIGQCHPDPPTSSAGGLPIALPADPATAKKLLSSMKKSAASFSNNVDGLNSQTMQVALLGGEMSTAQEISDLQQQMRDQDQRQKDGIEEIQSILDDMLNNQVVENMRKQVEKEIVDQIDELVREHIADCLKDHIPQDLQNDVADSKRELQEVRLALHNSESRRSNANLRSANPDEVLHTIYMSNGTVSTHFPKDLNSLFSLEGKHRDISSDIATQHVNVLTTTKASSVKALMNDYDISDPSESRDRNLNRFMQFLGVRYQLVDELTIRPESQVSTATA